MQYKLNPIKLHSDLYFKNVTLTHESRDVSVGFIFETQGQDSETISIKPTPLRFKSTKLKVGC